MLWLLMISIIFVTFLYNLPIKIKVKFMYKQNNIFLLVKCFNRSVINTSISFKDSQQDIFEILKQLPTKMSNTIQTLHTGKGNMIPYLRVIHIDKFLWRSVLGLGESSVTSFVFGNVWTFKGIITGWFAQQVKSFPKPELFVRPEFVNREFETELVCIGSIRLGKAMHILIKMKRYHK